MGEFKRLLGEIKRTLRKILVFDIFIEALLVFLCLYLLRTVFNVTVWVAIGPAFAYFIFMVIKRRDLTSIRTVEEKYPILNEALRTVNDTLTEDNYLVNQLRNEVKVKVKNVSASSFMDIKGDFLKILLTIGLVFLILSLSICKTSSKTCQTVFEKTDVTAAIENFDIENIYSKINGNKMKALDLSGVPIDSNMQADQILLTDESIVELGDDKIRIKIKLANDQIDIHDVSDEVAKKEFMDMDITEIGAKSDISFKEDISREHKEIVKNYFNQISR